MLTIQFGQCGNQVGHTLFSKISSDLECVNTGVSYNANYDYSEDTFNKWFSGISKDNKRLARAVLVDTEQKVIHKVYNEINAPWTYSTKNVICQTEGGCANNWAFGYLRKGYELSDVILNCIRQEVEALDHFDGFLSFLSSAGGTGSGVGSYITKLLREEYDKKSIITTTILPFSFGEVCTQNYNTLLTLAKLYNESDVNIVIENEQIYSMCTNLLKKTSTNLQDMNEIISEKLLAVLQPINHVKYSVNSLLSKIACHPSYKIATIKSTPHVPTTSAKYEPICNWNLYVRHLKQTLRIPHLNSQLTDVELKRPSSSLSNTMHHAYACSVSNILVTRGITTQEDLIMTNEFREKHLYAEWNTIDWFSHLHQNRKFLNYKKFLALITNNSEISYPLDTLLSKAWNTYVHSAYLHQYKQFGLEEDDFLQAFAVLENVVKEYKELVPYVKKE
ncbi:Tubulin delta chain [Habropoda laboriosa]|uniref:Tubulin delta chain n=1 Tax=Habropoda laboriosa TaxID=597456 RepID=A0A0L7QZ75_9HYME|nr:PREDICTED: tubulin delta chain-like [Habropoda laboriosa]KOC63898.1 Tubulin delta chain [Habropoda laboriosa]